MGGLRTDGDARLPALDCHRQARGNPWSLGRRGRPTLWQRASASSCAPRRVANAVTRCITQLMGDGANRQGGVDVPSANGCSMEVISLWPSLSDGVQIVRFELGTGEQDVRLLVRSRTRHERSRSPTPGWRAGERGRSVVELAIILPVLLLLVLAALTSIASFWAGWSSQTPPASAPTTRRPTLIVGVRTSWLRTRALSPTPATTLRSH